MKKRSLTALVLILAMAMASPGLNNAAERSVHEKEKTENAGNKKETPATASDLESKVNSGDVSEKKQNIVSLVIPQKLEVVIDPFEIDGKTQVYSEKYSIKNAGETKGVLQLTQLACKSGKSGEVKVRKNQDGIHDGEKKKIYLEMVLEYEKLKDNAAEENLKSEKESEKHIVLSQEDTSYEQVLEAGEEVVVYFCGEVNENASQIWENGDVEITVVYDWKEMTNESEEEIEEILEIPETTEETEDEEINKEDDEISEEHDEISEKEQEPEENGKEVGEESTGEADAEKIAVENTAEGSKESLDEIKEGSEESNGSLEETEERIEETKENVENIEEGLEETEKDLEKTEENSEKNAEEETEGTAEEDKGENKENEKIPAESQFGEENSSETEEKTEESDHQQEISSSEEKEDIGNTEDNEEKKDTEEIVSNSPTVNTENKRNKEGGSSIKAEHDECVKESYKTENAEDSAPNETK